MCNGVSCEPSGSKATLSCLTSMQWTLLYYVCAIQCMKPRGMYCLVTAAAAMLFSSTTKKMVFHKGNSLMGTVI